MNERNGTIDIVKLLASFCIIAFHIGYYEDYPVFFADLFRVSTRWALPFFFVAAGYFIGCSREHSITKRVNKLITIFLTASVFYSLILLLKNHSDIQGQISEIFSFKFLRGIYFHLWFIPSLIIGFIGLGYMRENLSERSALIISIIIITIAWVEDILVFLGKDVDFIFSREIMSIGLVYFGYTIAKHRIQERISKNKSIATMLLFIIALTTEAFILQEITGSSSRERQFPLFCSIAAVAILITCCKIKTKEGLLSELGKRYSLAVYLYHPLFISASRFALSKIGIHDSFAILIMTFISTLFVLIITDRYFNPLFKLINGDIFKRNKKEETIN